MALTDVEKVRLKIYDIPRNEQFYPLFTDEEYEQFLEDANGDITKAARYAASAASFYFVSLNYKEKYGDVEIWNEAGKNYIKLLEAFLNDSTLSNVIPNGLTPYAAGISRIDLYESMIDPDNPRTSDFLYTNAIEDSCCVSNETTL